MTGLVVRVMRDGKPVTVDFDELTDAEMDEFIRHKPVEQGWGWAIALGKWIRENVAANDIKQEPSVN